MGRTNAVITTTTVKSITQSEDGQSVIVTYTDNTIQTFEIPNVVTFISDVQTDNGDNKYLEISYLDGTKRKTYLLNPWGNNITNGKEFATYSYKNGIYSVTFNTGSTPQYSTTYILDRKLYDGEVFYYTMDFHGQVGAGHYISSIIGGVTIPNLTLNNLNGLNLHNEFASGNYYAIDFKWERHGRTVKIYFKKATDTEYVLVKTITLTSDAPAVMKLDSWSNEKYHYYTYTNFRIEDTITPTNFVEAYNQGYDFSGKSITFEDMYVVPPKEGSGGYSTVLLIFSNGYKIGFSEQDFNGKEVGRFIVQTPSLTIDIDQYNALEKLPIDYIFLDTGEECKVSEFYYGNVPIYAMQDINEITPEEFAEKCNFKFKINR